MKTLQCQDYVNVNDLTSRISLSLWHYNCLFFLKSDSQSSIMRFDNAAVALQRRIRMIFFYLSFYFTCVRLFICEFFFSFVNFHRRFIFVHPTSSRHSFTSEMNSNYKKNFFSQIQLFFLFSLALTDVQSFWNEKHFERSTIIASFERSAIVKKENGDFFRELKILIFSFHVNDSNFIDDICYTLIKCRKSDVDAIVLRYQISWLIILIEMTLFYILYDKIFFFVTAARRRREPCVFIKFFIFKWYALKNV